MNTNGYFLISLDFELYWGVHDKSNISSYEKNINEVWTILPRLINLFNDYNVECTFATVGYLFAQNRSELNSYLPKSIPNYRDKNLCPYTKLEFINFEESLFNALPLIQLISDSKHELGTHTFSHYYCLEEGQSKENFKSDINAAVKIANKKNVGIKSIVFPRNQVNENYFDTLKKFGIRSYRGSEKSWMYKPDKSKNEGLVKKLFRLTDSYINLSGYNTYPIPEKKQDLYNLPSSRFLRPFAPSLRIFEKKRLERITSAMNHAAQKNEVYHLWWHPHNFGDNVEENFLFLEKILKHYRFLSDKHNFTSVTMEGLSTIIDNR